MSTIPTPGFMRGFCRKTVERDRQSRRVQWYNFWLANLSDSDRTYHSRRQENLCHFRLVLAVKAPLTWLCYGRLFKVPGWLIAAALVMGTIAGATLEVLVLLTPDTVAKHPRPVWFIGIMLAASLVTYVFNLLLNGILDLWDKYDAKMAAQQRTGSGVNQAKARRRHPRKPLAPTRHAAQFMAAVKRCFCPDVTFVNRRLK